MHLLEVLNPVAQQRGVVTARPVNSRPSTLDNLTVGLVWSGTHGGDVALKRVGEMVEERYKGAKSIFYVSGQYPAPPHILKLAAEECDVVVGATAD